MNYVGNSMIPTLKTGDVLGVVTYKKRKIRAGDVIAFRSPRKGRLTAHRVVSVDQRGVRTKGDSALKKDDWVLHPDEVIGRVVSVWRGKKKISIWGGLGGQLYALALWAAKCADHALITVLRPFYIWLAEQGILRRVFPKLNRPQISCFKNREGTELQLRLGSRVIGRCLSGQDKWLIRRPFRLFIDESTLPSADDIEGKQKGHGVKGEKG
jgi:signal peptidase